MRKDSQAGISKHKTNSYDNTVKLWDIKTRACLQTLNAKIQVNHLSFDETGSYHRTDQGIISLETPSRMMSHGSQSISPQLPYIRGPGISVGAWITWNGQNLLWLPPDYRPGQSAVAGSTVAVGCPSGRVVLFPFETPFPWE